LTKKPAFEEQKGKFLQIKGIKSQGKPWTLFSKETPPQADGVLKTLIKELTNYRRGNDSEQYSERNINGLYTRDLSCWSPYVPDL